MAEEYSDKPIEVSDADFDSTVSKYPLVVVDCWAAWCGACKAAAPVIEELARDYKGKIVFAKLDTEANSAVPQKYNVMSIPTFLVFKNGELVETIIGALPREMLEPKLKQHL